jgi:hypothetical protein
VRQGEHQEGDGHEPWPNPRVARNQGSTTSVNRSRTVSPSSTSFFYESAVVTPLSKFFHESAVVALGYSSSIDNKRWVSLMGKRKKKIEFETTRVTVEKMKQDFMVLTVDTSNMDDKVNAAYMLFHDIILR